MSSVMYWIIGIMVFFTVIMFSVALHEAGHMGVAKALRIPVPKYFVGFGPTLWSTKRGETEYGMKAFPLGGFILVEDTTQPVGSPERSLLSHVAPWKRTLIFIAGPAVNILLGVAIVFTTLMFTPYEKPTTTIGVVNSCETTPTNCSAEKAGFKEGDVITKLNGERVNSFDDMRKVFTPDNNVVVKRGNQTLKLNVKTNSSGTIGVMMGGVKVHRSASESISAIGSLLYMNVEALAKIPSQVPGLIKAIVGEEKRDDQGVSSIIGAGKAYGETVDSPKLNGDDKIRTLAMMSGALNLGLGFANLLPMLPLDGGRIMFAFFDAVKIRLDRLRKRRYQPTDARWVQVVTAVTGTAVAGFMLLVLIADVVAPMSSA